MAARVSFFNVHPLDDAAQTNKMLTRRRLVKHVLRKNSRLLRCARCPRGRRVRHRSSQNSCTITRASLPDTRVADAITACGTEVELCNLSAPCEWIVGATASSLRSRAPVLLQASALPTQPQTAPSQRTTNPANVEAVPQLPRVRHCRRCPRTCDCGSRKTRLEPPRQHRRLLHSKCRILLSRSRRQAPTPPADLCWAPCNPSTPQFDGSPASSTPTAS